MIALRCSLRSLLVAALPALVVACASVEPDAERAAVRQDVATRLTIDVPMPPIDALDPAVDAACRELLGDELTEDAAIRIALLNNRGLRAIYERLGIARADLVQAGLLRNPVFEAEPLFLFRGNGERELGLLQPLADLFYRPLRQRLAEHEMAAEQARVAAAMVQLVFQVRRACVLVRTAQQRVALHQRAVAAAAASHLLMRQLFAAGNATEQQLAAQRVAETGARLELAAAEQAAQEAREPLQALLGLWGEHTNWSLAGAMPMDPPPDLALDDVESRGVAASFALAENRARLGALAERVGLEQWQGWLRTFDLGLAATKEPGDSWDLGPILRFEIPLFDRGQAQQAKAAAELRAAAQRHVQIAIEVRAAARLLRARVQLASDRLQFFRGEHLPARADLLLQTQRTYNAMQTGAFTVLDARQDQLADYGRFLDQLADLHLARLDALELLAGGMPSARLPLGWPDPQLARTTSGDRP